MVVDPGGLTDFTVDKKGTFTSIGNTCSVTVTGIVTNVNNVAPNVGKTVTVTSSNPNVATVVNGTTIAGEGTLTVTADIVITGVAPGNSTITLSFTDGASMPWDATVDVKVIGPEEKYLSKTGLKYFYDNLSIDTPKISNGAVTSDKVDWTTTHPTKSTTTSGGSTTAYWVKRVYPNGIIVYSGYATAYWWTGANAWYADLTIRLPDSLTFDTAKMMASISVQPADSAVQGWGSVHEGANSWSICRNNRYGADITTTFYINLILVVFPT